MSEILILARVRINQLDLPVIADYYFEISEKLAQLSGFLGLSVWRDASDPESFLVIYDYADLEATEKGLHVISQARTLAESTLADFRPADVIRVRVARKSSKRVHQAPSTGCLSMSVRISDPGYAPELKDEIRRIFDELQLLPGYFSHVFGSNDALDEEVIGLVTWKTEEAFASSLPARKAPGQLQFYKRFF